MTDRDKCLHEAAGGLDDVGMVVCSECGGSWPWSIDDYVQTVSHVANGPVEDFPLPVGVLRAWLIELRAGRIPTQAFEQVGEAANSNKASNAPVVFLTREEVLILLEHFHRNHVEESEAALTRVLASRKIYEREEEMVSVPKRILEKLLNDDWTEQDELELLAVLADHNQGVSETKASEY